LQGSIVFVIFPLQQITYHLYDNVTMIIVLIRILQYYTFRNEKIKEHVRYNVDINISSNSQVIQRNTRRYDSITLI